MSVLFLPPSAGAASVPDATETTAGKIRIATSAEATAGTNDLTSMTPLKVKSVVDAALVGGVTYQGTFDASSPADLSNASKGDLYIISVAGSYQGQDWAVGDHLLINADMGGTLDPNKIDKVDNTDSVTSVAGRTGAVVLSASDVSGLATVATSGAYSDLSGTPSLATVATTGAYSDLSGTPDVPDFQTITISTNTTLSASLEDGCYLIMFTAAATATIPAYPAGKSLVFRFVNFGVGACTVQQASSGARLYEFGNSGVTGVNSITIASGVTRTLHLWAAGSTVGTNYWSEASPSSTSGTVAALDDIGDVTITTPANTQVIKYNSTSGDWENGAVAYADVSGTPSLATIATTGDYSDLNDSVVVQGFNATATAAAISSNALHVFRFYGAGGFTLTLPTATVINGFALFNNVSGSDVTVTGPTFRPNGEGSSGGSTSITVKAGERRLYYVETVTLLLEANSTLIEHNADVSITSPSNGEALIYNSTSGDWENGAVAYADVSGTPTLATVATTGAYSDLSGTPTLGTAAALDVGTSATNVVQLDGSARLPAVDGSQLTNLPSGASTLGALTDVTITGVANGEALIYNSTSGDWENGTVSASVAALNDIGDVSAAAPNNGDVIAYNSTSGDWEPVAQGISAMSVTVSSPSTDQTLGAPSGIEEAYIYTPSANITVNLAAAATAGSGFKYNIKNRSTNTITIDPNGSEAIDGSSTFALSTQNASVTLLTDGSNWFII